jgi:hypothetical protein
MTCSGSRSSTQIGPNMPIYALSSIYSIYTVTTDKNLQLLASLIAAHHAVCLPQAASQRFPHPVSNRAMSAAASCSASLRCARSPPLCVVPHTSPGRSATDVVIPHQEAVDVVDVGTAATLDLSSRHYKIRSGHTRSGLL